MGAHHWSPRLHTGVPSGRMYFRGTHPQRLENRRSSKPPRTRARSHSADSHPGAGTAPRPVGVRAEWGASAPRNSIRPSEETTVRANLGSITLRERPGTEATRQAPALRHCPETARGLWPVATVGRRGGGTAEGRSVLGRRGVSELGRVGARHCGRPRVMERFRVAWLILRRVTRPFTEKVECVERVTSTTV